jgi:hypothetical protein
VRPTCWPSAKLSWRTGSCGRRGSAALFRQRVGRRGGVPSGRRARQRSIGSGSAVGAAAVVFYPPQAPGCRRGHCAFQRSPHTCCAGARPRTGRWQRGRTQAGSTNGRLRRCRLRAPAREAGLPTDVLHVLPGGGDIGRELVTHPDVPVIAFTGSVNAGREVARLAAGLLKRVHLELAGNSALVVLEDADLEQAVTAGSFGSFHNAGQVCMAASRHLVAAPIIEEYTALLAERADKLRVGDPAADDDVAYGPLIDALSKTSTRRHSSPPKPATVCHSPSRRPT